jgi:hypothetical protein
MAVVVLKKIGQFGYRFFTFNASRAGMPSMIDRNSDRGF